MTVIINMDLQIGCLQLIIMQITTFRISLTGFGTKNPPRSLGKSAFHQQAIIDLLIDLQLICYNTARVKAMAAIPMTTPMIA